MSKLSNHKLHMAVYSSKFRISYVSLIYLPCILSEPQSCSATSVLFYVRA